MVAAVPALVHVEIDRGANKSFADLPGFAEFRTWYGQDGDFLGVPVQDGGKPLEDAGAPMTQGSGY